MSEEKLNVFYFVENLLHFSFYVNCGGCFFVQSSEMLGT